jgi:hypothetical protein
MGRLKLILHIPDQVSQTRFPSIQRKTPIQMARQNHGHSHGPSQGSGGGGGGGGRREFSPRDQRQNPRPRDARRPIEAAPESFFEEEVDHEANETEIATYLTIRAQNIELLGLAARIAGCAEPKQLLNDIETEANMRRLEEIYMTLGDWVDPDDAGDDVDQ